MDFDSVFLLVEVSLVVLIISCQHGSAFGADRSGVYWDIVVGHDFSRWGTGSLTGA